MEITAALRALAHRLHPAWAGHRRHGYRVADALAQLVERTGRTSGLGLAVREVAEIAGMGQAAAARWLHRLCDDYGVLRLRRAHRLGEPTAARYDVAHPSRWRLPAQTRRDTALLELG